MKEELKVRVIVEWVNGEPQYQEGIDVTPSYSRSGGQVVKIGTRFFVPTIDSQYGQRWFETLSDAWKYCEAAYYSYN